MMGEPVVKVVVPWRPDGGMRSALWDYCRAWWESRGVVPNEAPAPDGPFNRGAAINAALEGSDFDVAVVMDADVVAPVVQVWQGVDLAVAQSRLVLPYTLFVGLAPWGTRAVVAGGEDVRQAGALRAVHDHESSIVIIPRNVWEATGGFDERFVGWGQDDVAFCQAARVLAGEPRRVSGTVYHLWHHPAVEKKYGHPLWEANQALGRRYRAATTVEAMEALRWEQNGKPSSPPSTRRTHGTG